MTYKNIYATKDGILNKQQIRKLRKSLKLNTAAFGELVGVSGRTVEAWEQGLRQPSKSARMLIEKLIRGI